MRVPSDAWKTLRGFPPYARITVGWITLRLSTEGTAGSSLLLRLAHAGFPSMMPGKIAGPRAGAGRRVENAARFSTLLTVTVGWITLCLSTEGTAESSLLPQLAQGGLPSMMPGQIAGPRAGAGRRVENAVRFSTLRTDNRRVDNAPLIHRRRWRIEPVTSTCARRRPLDDAAEIAGPRAGVGRRVENAARFSTLRTVTVGWITLCLSTEGAGGSSLLHQLVRGGSPRWCPRRSPVRSWRQ